MRQNRNRSTTPGYANASTCGFFTQKGRCARGFQNLPHTSDRRFRKCGENPRSADQTQVLDFCDLRLCCQNRFVLVGFRFFSALPENEALHHVFLKQKTASATTSSSRKTSKGRCRKTEQRPFFFYASRRVHDDYITGYIYSNVQHPGFSEMRCLFCKLVPNLEAIQLAIWQIAVFL